ncbi:MAG: TIGR03546 family protein [Spirochaetia bacterium]
MITLVARFIAALNANSRPGEIAAGFACGILLALIPFGNLLWVLLFVVFFLLKLHAGTLLFTTVLFKLFIGIMDPLVDFIGLSILTQPSLTPYFITAINTPLLPLMDFNNSLVIGGLVLGLLMWIPLFYGGRALVKIYRKDIRDKLASSKVVKTFERVPWIRKLTTAIRKSTALYQGWNS